MKRLAVIAAAVALTGCTQAQRLAQQLDTDDGPAPTYTVTAECDTFTLTLAGWPEGTTMLAGVGNYPPFRFDPINSTATIPVGHEVIDSSGTYGWTLHIGDAVNVTGVSTPCN